MTNIKPEWLRDCADYVEGLTPSEAASVARPFSVVRGDADFPEDSKRDFIC